MTRIEKVACIDTNGSIWSLDPPNRHHNVLWEMHKYGAKEVDAMDSQGFLTDKGIYVTRCEAFKIATEANQVKLRIPGKYNGLELFSEDLW